MLKYSILFQILLGFFLVSSCNEDFQLTEPWKDIPVVYGMLNRFDSAQYIRLEKAFVSEDLSARELAKYPDSIYYKNAKVTLINKTANKSYQLSKVDMSQENYTRNEGDFVTSPNYMYKIKTKDMILRAQDNIELQVDRGDGSKLITSNIQMIKDVRLAEVDTSFRELGFDPNKSSSFYWNAPADVQVFTFKMNIKVEELNIGTGKKEIKVISSNLLVNSLETSFSYNGKSFFDAIKSNFTPDNQIKRSVQFVTLELKAGAKELREFLNIVNANTGITASQEIPRYTNISEGFGILTSSSYWTKNYFVSPNTVILLRTLDETKNLGF
ncbi:MAG: hypothetical protein WBB17_09480 [Saprospiraceae bacterium]|nr:hypothetical protein [Saprospiraceae bacterium]MBK7467551.1 hypothetical protein [Saprospiraceae bacterium]MBK9993234.1 hypothetical protein [Saprospiraceae bacterium]